MNILSPIPKENRGIEWRFEPPTPPFPLPPKSCDFPFKKLSQASRLMLHFNFIYIAIILPGYKRFGKELTNLDTILSSSPGQIWENWDFLCEKCAWSLSSYGIHVCNRWENILANFWIFWANMDLPMSKSMAWSRVWQSVACSTHWLMTSSLASVWIVHEPRII